MMKVNYEKSADDGIILQVLHHLICLIECQTYVWLYVVGPDEVVDAVFAKRACHFVVYAREYHLYASVLSAFTQVAQVVDAG